MSDQPEQQQRNVWESLAGAARRNSGLIAAAGAVAAIAGTALFNRGRARRALAASPSLGAFVEVDGVRLRYLERGTGRPVLLLHGNGAMIEDWIASDVLDRAAVRYRVIAIDRPGFGHSDRPRTTVWTPAAQAALIVGALAAISVARPIVVGHSWAALVAAAMALDFPDEVAALVLLSGYYFPTARPDLLLAAPAVPLPGDAMRFTVAPVVGRLATPLMTQAIFAPQPIAERFASLPVEKARRPSQNHATSADTALLVPAAAALGARYGDIARPVVIVAGDGDVIADFATHARKLHDRIAASELRIVVGGGHMFHYAEPDAVIAAIDRAAELAGM